MGRLIKATMNHEHPSLYNRWVGMKGRCFNPRNKDYERYGGRGVIVIDEWRYSFDEFANWALENGFSKELTLDRFPNLDGPYAPNNCRWATWTQQSRNRRNNTLLTFRGKTKPTIEWAEEYNLLPSTITVRIRLGWSIEHALTTPPDQRKGWRLIAVEETAHFRRKLKNENR